ncbi:MAG: hypothetical protein WBO70_01160 [Erysipelotrichaceae bacterium]
MKKSSLTLMEIIFSILMFSIGSVICIQLFVQSYLISEKNQATSKGILVVTSMVSLLNEYDLEKSAEIMNGTYNIKNKTLVINNDGTIIEARDQGNEKYQVRLYYQKELVYENNIFIHKPIKISSGVGYE